MKNLILFIFTLFATCISMAQTPITWKGGNQGEETLWSEVRNWDKHRLTNENDRVIIQPKNIGHFAQSIISGEVCVAWVEIYAGTSLSVTKNVKLNTTRSIPIVRGSP